jgi:hypothetical protein
LYCEQVQQDVVLCKIFQFDSALSAEWVLKYSLYKRNSCLGAHLKPLVNLLEVLPVTSADCERGFSQMNLCHNECIMYESRNRLSTSTVSDLLMISINSPPIGHWNATTYVVSWLKAGRHRTLDAPRGVPKRQVESPIKCKLFA